MNHGTLYSYVRGKCRCDECRQANANYKRSLRQRPLPPGDPLHGTANGYNNHNCRCGPCKAAWSELDRDRRTERTDSKMRIGLALSLLEHQPRHLELLDEVRLALLGATVEDLMQQRKDRE